MAQRVGSMVGDRVLTKDYVTHEISRFDIAELLARGAERIKPADLEAAVRALASWAAEQVTPSATGDAALWLTRLARANPIAPLLATGIEIARKQGWDQRLIEAVAAALVDALDRPDFRATVGDAVDEMLAGYRAQMGVYPRILMGLASTFGLIDRERIVSALHEAVKKIADDPDDPLRGRLTQTLAVLPERLRSDPGLAARVEAAKEELLASPAVARLFEDAAVGLRKIVIADLAARAVRAGELDDRAARPRAADAGGRHRAAAKRSIAGSRRGSPRRWTATTTASRTSSSAASTRSARRARCDSSRSTRVTTSSTSA